MKTASNTLSISKVIFWFVAINAPLFAITFYVHYLLEALKDVPGNNVLENIGLWLLITFKVIGANIILGVIISDFKIKYA